MSLKKGYQKPNQLVFKAPVKEKKGVVVNGIDLLENVPPRTENEVCSSDNCRWRYGWVNG
jgi:coronin-2